MLPKDFFESCTSPSLILPLMIKIFRLSTHIAQPWGLITKPKVLCLAAFQSFIKPVQSQLWRHDYFQAAVIYLNTHYVSTVGSVFTCRTPGSTISERSDSFLLFSLPCHVSYGQLVSWLYMSFRPTHIKCAALGITAVVQKTSGDHDRLKIRNLVRFSFVSCLWRWVNMYIDRAKKHEC